MLLKEIVKSCLDTLKLKADDEESIGLIKNSINEGYIILSSLDKRVSKAYLPIINGVATTPSDFLKIVKSTPTLTSEDRLIGDSIITDKTGVIELLYEVLREPIIDEELELDLSLALQYALVNYACYKMFEKEDRIRASYYYDLFLRTKDEFEKNQDFIKPEYIVFVE